MSNNLENYEEKYNQALKRAKEFMTNKGVSPNADAFKTAKELTETIFPELRESEDERIRKEIIQSIKDNMCAIHKEKCLAWLEKQGEKETLCDKCRKEQPSHSCQDITALGRCALEKQKFNVGDWITNGEYTWKVTDIKPLDYILQSQNGDVVDDTISYVDEEFHLWTIQDVKDGDVLLDKNPFIFRGFEDKEHPNSPTAYCGINLSDTFILSEENHWWTADYCYPATKEQRELLFQKMKEAGYEWDSEKKELRKIEQESTWNEKYIADVFEKVGLARIVREQGNDQLTNAVQSAMIKLSKQQKSAWSEEDEKHCQGCLNLMRLSLDTKSYPYYNDFLWLKSLRDRVKSQQPKQEWSEEDEKISNAIYESIDFLCLKSLGFCEDEVCDWLKSKDRVRPQQEWSEEDEKVREKLISYFNSFDESTSFHTHEILEIRQWLKSIKPNHWKPSEEQMEALHSSLHYLPVSIFNKVECLYNDLKNFKS